MPQHNGSQPSPHRFAVDLSPLEGVEVLGEPLALLFSALLRLEIGAQRDGMADMSATLPRDEAEAIERAMARSEREVPGDSRTDGQRNCDRFMTVAERVFEVSQALSDHASRGAA